MALTWRNVEAPDFRPAMQGYESFSNLLGGAISGLQGGLRTYDKTISDQVNNEIQLKLAGLQEAEAAKAFAAQLATDPNAARINAATIGVATARPGELISQAANQENLRWSLRGHNRVEGFDAAEDAAAPLMQAYMAANAAGKGGEFIAANPNFGKGLSMGAQGSLFTTGQDVRSKDLSIVGQGITNEGGRINNAGGIISNEASRFNLDVSKLNYQEGRQAQDFMAKYLGAGNTGEDIDGVLATSGLSGAAQMAIRSQMGGFATGGGTGSGGASGGSAAGADRVMNYQARAAGFASIPDSVKTLGDASDFAIQVNRAGAESSAMGLYQIVGQTMRGYAPKVFGNNWRSVDMNVQNQDKLAEAIFNDHRGSAEALRKQWVSLSPQKAEEIRKLPWAQARQVIAQGESGGNPAALLISKTLGEQGSKYSTMQRNANSVAEPIQAALSVTGSTPVGVASDLVNKGSLAGANRSWVTKQIEKIMTDSGGKINAAAAGVILSQNVTTTVDGAWAIPDTWNKRAIGGGLEVKPDGIAASIASVKKGDYQKVVVGNTEAAARDAMVNTAEQKFTAAKNKLEAVRQKAALNPSFNPAIIGRANIEFAAAQAAYNAALGIRGDAAQQQGGMGEGEYRTPPVYTGPRRGVTQPGWIARDANARMNTGGARASSLMQHYLRTPKR